MLKIPVVVLATLDPENTSVLIGILPDNLTLSPPLYCARNLVEYAGSGGSSIQLRFALPSESCTGGLALLKTTDD